MIKILKDIIMIASLFVIIYLVALFQPLSWTVGTLADEFGDPIKTVAQMDTKSDGIVVYHVYNKTHPLFIVEVYDSVGSVGEAQCIAKTSKGIDTLSDWNFVYYDKRKHVDTYTVNGDTYYDLVKLLVKEKSFKIALTSKDQSTVIRTIKCSGFVQSYKKTKR